MSRMDVLEKNELEELIENSKLIGKYNEAIDRESAYEMLNKKIEVAEREETRAKAEKENEDARRSTSRRGSGRKSKRYQRQNPVVKVLTSPTVIRSVLGILGKLLK